MTKGQKRALQFAANHPGWQSFAGDYSTRKVIHALANRGYVELSEVSDQFRITERGHRAARSVFNKH